MKDLPVDYLDELFEYDHLTGHLVWKARPRHHFSSDISWKCFLTKYEGKIAGSVNKKLGYREVGIDGQVYKCHRVAWAIFHREWPYYIDHENGVRDDNRIDNLSDVNILINNRNAKSNKRNSSGHRGVSLQDGRWRAYIGSQYIGMFGTFDEAVIARLDAEKIFGYGKNHGGNST